MRSVLTPIGTVRVVAYAEGNLPIGAPVTLSIRPEDLRISQEPETISLGEAIVTDATFLGPHRKIMVEHVRAREVRLTLLLPHAMTVMPGETVPLFVRTADITLLSA